ncbi:dihydropteroate synthase [Dehalogenimonas alkenigignens]|uniref:Methyltetrahydrofolate--corrinoid iron-sulfur protein Co-methyltransferase n=1 Tax=Dehalogenimonas alkenigignens TaxID=1217799 RepID=A0A0W0GJ88_9CHLR|nr:dihydropteroate synthase [Dehalogenimonas alkenigignens]KTB48609.1 methyltetrahydrofolate--corrinoid iron-sulfur protein Co-methyltransferase [Dehalogenimonas alkenigignens]PVV84954.1 dihydropteroate synthase [Dehalogenimonas alkenigignens]
MVILIGENINVMSQTIGPALKERRKEPIESLVAFETRAGMDMLDLNIGPAKKTGVELMSWLVNIVQEVSCLPLSLDTTNSIAIEEGLRLCRQRALVNSVSLQPERLKTLLPLVKQYSAEMIGLLWGIEGMPRDVDERCLLAVDLVYKANEHGIPNEDIWIDPIVTPISGDIAQINTCTEFLAVLPEICPGCKSVVGLSNISNGTPTPLRSILNRTYLVMLMRRGLYAAIVDSFDKELLDIARGRRPDIVDLVHRTLDGEVFNLSYLAKWQQDYVKTVKVLTGRTLYSHSWLEV